MSNGFSYKNGNYVQEVDRKLDLAELLNQFGYDNIINSLSGEDKEFIDSIRERDFKEVRTSLLEQLNNAMAVSDKL
jgi:hypothetical protein